MYDNILDFKLHSENYIANLPWRSICWLQYRKNSPNIFYKTSFKDDEFVEVQLQPKRGRRPNKAVNNAYTTELPIAIPKFRDLQKMCADSTIPKVHHRFYNNLKTSATERDRLNQPDAEEDDSE